MITSERISFPVIMLFTACLFLTGSCQKANIVTDIEGNRYQTLIVGEQEWFKENLRTTKYRDGTDIPAEPSPAGWSALTTGAHAVYPHSLIEGLSSGAEVLETYGALYNWYAVETGKLCPVGWRVPTREDWDILIDYVGGERIAGGKLKSVRTVPNSHPRWNAPNTGATDDWGFTALPSDHRSSDGEFFSVGSFSAWWTSTETDAGNANDVSLGFISDAVTLDSVNKKAGFSIRCVRDLPPE